MAFIGIDDIVQSMAAGQRNSIPFIRTIQTGATSVAGRWHEAFTATGTGGTGSLSGTAGVGVAYSSATTGALPQTNATVSPDTKHLMSMLALTPATTAVPGTILLTDILYVYPSCVVTGTPTTLNNGAAKPTRHNNGIGVECSAIVNGALGAATPTLTVTYTNSGGTGSRTGTVASSANSLPVGAFLGGGTAGQLTSPYMIRAAGDAGVRELNSYTIASGTTGTVSLVLHRPIAEIPLVAANTAGEREFLSQLPALPPIDDDACLALFVNIGGALTASQIITGRLVTAWG
jgi:hypothetical protein